MDLKGINDSKLKRLSIMTTGYVECLQSIHKEQNERIGTQWVHISHGNVLLCLYGKGECTMSEIAENINRTAPTTTVLVNKLRKEKMLTSRKSDDDSRKQIVSLTEKGRDYCHKIEGYLSIMADAVSRELTDEEINQYTDMIKRVQRSAFECMEEFNKNKSN